MTDICPGDSIPLTATGGDSYLWEHRRYECIHHCKSSATYTVAVSMVVAASNLFTNHFGHPVTVPITTVYGTNPYCTCNSGPQLGVANSLLLIMLIMGARVCPVM